MKEETTLSYRFSEWYVYKAGHREKTVTEKRMTPKQALRHFDADAVVGIK